MSGFVWAQNLLYLILQPIFSQLHSQFHIQLVCISIEVPGRFPCCECVWMLFCECVAQMNKWNEMKIDIVNVHSKWHLHGTVRYSQCMQAYTHAKQSPNHKKGPNKFSILNTLCIRKTIPTEKNMGIDAPHTHAQSSMESVTRHLVCLPFRLKVRA